MAASRLACALGVALDAIGHAAGAHFFVARQFADTFFHAAFGLIANALGLTLRVGGVVLGMALGLEVLIAGRFADALLHIAFQLVDSIAHDRVTSFHLCASVRTLPQKRKNWTS